jgi:Mg-chelatase subunit ChlD
MGTSVLTAWIAQPYFLFLLPLYGWLMWRWRQAILGLMAAPSVRRKARLRMLLHGLGALCLVLAAAGVQVPAQVRCAQLVVVADASESVRIFDLNAQTQRVRELLRALDGFRAEVGVVVFAGSASTERPLSPLEISPEPSSARGRGGRNSGLPDLLRLTGVVEPHTATDIGAALSRARGLFTGEGSGGRGILLLSDFRDTVGGAESAAAALSGSGTDLLLAPAVPGQSQDVHVASVCAPEWTTRDRAVPVEITVATFTPCSVQVSLSRQGVEPQPVHIGARTVVFRAEDKRPGGELCRTVRLVDPNPGAPGLAVYTARVTPVEGELINDNIENNQLAAAVRVFGSSHWAVLTRRDATLARLCAAEAAARPLGVQTTLFYAGALPRRASDYQRFDGIVVDGLSAGELDDAALKALAEAAAAGKGLLALGGDAAFGAGKHLRGGQWEQLLPVNMTPQDDNTRSVLFLIDVSDSMKDDLGRARTGTKLDFARECLGQAVLSLKPNDRVGLITFSGSAKVAAPLADDPLRGEFLAAVKNIEIISETDLLPAIQEAQRHLASDTSEEQLVIMLSDGVQTRMRDDAELLRAVRQLCPLSRDAIAPRRTTFYTFGIGAGPGDSNPVGENRLRLLAEEGGGRYSADFLNLRARLDEALRSKRKDFWTRREPFAVGKTGDHALLGAAGDAWPTLLFRNRVQAKPGAETLLMSAPADAESHVKKTPDPLLALSGHGWSGAARCAALALGLDGEGGARLLASPAGRALLPSLIEWLEGKNAQGGAGWSLSASIDGDNQVLVELALREADGKTPRNGAHPQATLVRVERPGVHAEPVSFGLQPAAPGLYKARAAAPSGGSGVYHLTVSEGAQTGERHITVPYPKELRRFGTDRSEMQKLAAKAGNESFVIERPADLARWVATRQATGAMYSLRFGLLMAGMALLLAEYAARAMRSK